MPQMLSWLSSKSSSKDVLRCSASDHIAEAPSCLGWRPSAAADQSHLDSGVSTLRHTGAQKNGSGLEKIFFFLQDENTLDKESHLTCRLISQALYR